MKCPEYKALLLDCGDRFRDREAGGPAGLVSKLRVLVVYLHSQTCSDGVVINSLITGITSRNDVHRMQQDQTPYGELHRVVGLLGAVGKMVIKVSEVTAEMFKRAGSFETFCKEEESRAASSSELLVTTYQNKRRHTPEGHSIAVHTRGGKDRLEIWV
jgi:hypothetical protein